jgi:hypothetical protein
LFFFQEGFEVPPEDEEKEALEYEEEDETF